MRTENINPIAPQDITQAESEKSRATDENFEKFLEKEKLKIALFPLLVNFRSFLDSTSSFMNDQKISDNRMASLQVDRKFNASMEVDRDEAGAPKVSDHKHNGTVNAEAQAVKNSAYLKHTDEAADRLSNTFFVDLRLSADFQDILLRAKNRAASIKEVGIDELMKEIIDKAKIVRDSEKTELLLKLKPDNLGEILVSISKDKGSLSIVLYAKDSTRDILAESLSELEKNLKNSNLNISGLKVTVDDRKHNGSSEGTSEILSIPSGSAMLYNEGRMTERPVSGALVEKALGLDYLRLIYSDA